MGNFFTVEFLFHIFISMQVHQRIDELLNQKLAGQVFLKFIQNLSRQLSNSVTRQYFNGFDWKKGLLER